MDRCRFGTVLHAMVLGSRDAVLAENEMVSLRPRLISRVGVVVIEAAPAARRAIALRIETGV